MNLIYTSQFKKDFKKISKQDKDISKLEFVIKALLDSQVLELKYKDHSLSGKWKNHRDCHIEPDWLLIFRITSDSLILERTGSHSDLFK
ncbi:MAG: type II toxin-antitoxin system YafQ family toxin [Ignavibacteria bacterium]|nr:type II toxin-antitoxin system YafQ family toxin [Ignavibacteria bacterium]MDP3829693.1 type II toxin-antitoxin system YafQ family toxin [Ignavibacteriaceae bacterium]